MTGDPITADRPVEVELKYRVIDADKADRLVADHRLGEFVATGPARTSQHEDHYVDTADGALARAGFAVRLRQSAGATIVSAKSLHREGSGSLHRRDEIEGPADRSMKPHDWPGSPARSMILELAGDAPLVELVALRQLRRKRRYARDGTEIEISLDSVDVVDRGRIIDTFRELEVELVAGDEDRLESLAAILDASPALVVAERSKYELALDAAGIVPGRTAGVAVGPGQAAKAGRSRKSNRSASSAGRADPPKKPAAPSAPATKPEVDPAVDPPLTDAAAGPEPEPLQPGEPESTETQDPLPALVVGKTPGVQADDTLAEAGRKVLRFHLARMLAREAGTRAGDDIEELHAMRVATRRMRAAWRVFGDAYRPNRTRRYRRDLRDVAARLGAVRDLDVLLEGLEAYAKTQPSAERTGLGPLETALRTRREEARVLLIRTLDAPGYVRFVEEYREFVGADGFAVLPVAPTSPHRVRDRMPSRIWAAYEQVRGYEPVLRWADVETLHELRIAAKWLRYTIEFVREPLGPDVTPLIERVVALQDHLGYLHDADVAAGLARSYLVEHAGALSDHESAAIGRYLVDRERELARLRRTVGPPWRRVAGLGYRRALGRLIAGL